MKKIITAIGFQILIILSVPGQERYINISLPDTISKYFDYENLNKFPCTEFPTGIYSLTFRITRNSKVVDFEFSNDSLQILKKFLLNAVSIGVKKCHVRKSRKRYLQQFYFNNILWCSNTSDSALNSTNLWKEVSKLLSDQLASIESSFRRCIKNTDKHQILKPVIINNMSPNSKKQTGFWNDIQHKERNNEEKERIIKQIEEMRKKKSGIK